MTPAEQPDFTVWYFLYSSAVVFQVFVVIVVLSYRAERKRADLGHVTDTEQASGLYEWAYATGGPRRVMATALLALQRAGFVVVKRSRWQVSWVVSPHTEGALPTLGAEVERRLYRELERGYKAPSHLLPKVVDKAMERSLEQRARVLGIVPTQDDGLSARQVKQLVMLPRWVAFGLFFSAVFITQSFHLFGVGFALIVFSIIAGGVLDSLVPGQLASARTIASAEAHLASGKFTNDERVLPAMAVGGLSAALPLMPLEARAAWLDTYFHRNYSVGGSSCSSGCGSGGGGCGGGCGGD